MSTSSIHKEKSSIDEMFRQSLKYKNSEEYQQFFAFISKFNHYSRYNTMLVYIQNPAVTFFGTSSYWKNKFSRQIIMGARPLIILAPNGPIILAYDVLDTTGKKSAEEFLKSGFKTDLFEVKGNFDEKYLYALANYGETCSIKIETKPLSYFNAGAVTTYVSNKLEIYLKEGHSPAQHFSTLCHELAHVLLGHTGHKQVTNKNKQKPIKLPERLKLTQTQQELEAETVNFLVCKRLGLEVKSLEYLAGYIQDEKDWEFFSYDLVIKAADKLEGLLSRTLVTAFPSPRLPFF